MSGDAIARRRRLNALLLRIMDAVRAEPGAGFAGVVQIGEDAAVISTEDEAEAIKLFVDAFSAVWRQGLQDISEARAEGVEAARERSGGEADVGALGRPPLVGIDGGKQDGDA